MRVGQGIAVGIPRGLAYRFRIPGYRPGFRRLLQRAWCPRPLAAHLPSKHPRDANAVSLSIVDLLAFADLFGASVNGFVCVFVRRGKAAPLEETDQFAADFEVSVGSSIAIGTKRGQQSVEGILCQRPLLPGSIRGLLRERDLQSQVRPLPSKSTAILLPA